MGQCKIALSSADFYYYGKVNRKDVCKANITLVSTTVSAARQAYAACRCKIMKKSYIGPAEIFTTNTQTLNT